MRSLLMCASILSVLGATACGASGSETTAVDDTPIAKTSAALTDDVPVIRPRFVTPPLWGYDDAPRAPDSDDPAIWVNPKDPSNGLFFGALKNAGLQVYDLKGNVVQTIVPPNRAPVSAVDPTVPGPQPDPGTSACPESESGETYGRFNNIDVQYGFPAFDKKHGLRKIDVLIATDRGCDRVRTYEIVPGRAGGPLVEITAPSAPRVFPQRFVQPSPFQSPGETARVEDNPLDDQSTAYGLTLQTRGGGTLHAFVTQRSRSVVAELALVPLPDGTVTYAKVREFRFPVTFDIPKKSGRGTQKWSACREDPTEDLQLEGLTVDQQKGILYASQEVIGVWEIPITELAPRTVNVPVSRLVEKTKSFGQAFFAVPDDDEFSCEEPSSEPPEGAIAVDGNPVAAGQFLNADVEGLAIYYTRNERGYLLVSSQGDDTFHVYGRSGRAALGGRHRHLATFEVESTGDTDGHEVVNVPMGPDFPKGLFISQNGKAPEPVPADPINGFEFDNATQFKLLGWDDIAGPLNLDVDTRSYDPRRP